MPAPSDPVGVTLAPAVSLADYRWAGAVRLRVVATDPVGWDGAPFLYRTSPVDVLTGVAAHVYMGVCGPIDLADWPVGEPDPTAGGGPPPFFRATTVELDLPSPVRLQEVWAGIQEEVDLLTRGVRALRVLVAQPPVVLLAGGPAGGGTAGLRLTEAGGPRLTEAGVPRRLDAGGVSPPPPPPAPSPPTVAARQTEGGVPRVTEANVPRVLE